MDTSNGCNLCLIETCSIYRIGITRLGICHVIDGLVAVLVGSALMWMNMGTMWSGIGVWTGLPMMITGIICFSQRHRMHRGKISAVTIAAIVTVMATGFLVASSSYNIDRLIVSTNATDYFPQYKFPENKTPLALSNSSLIFFGLVEMVVCIWSATISMGVVCMCCHIAKDQVFTIPYEGMENEGPSGPDIVPDRDRQQNHRKVDVFMEEELDDSALHTFTDEIPPEKARKPSKAKTNQPPILEIDMDFEWDEMTSPVDDEVEISDILPRGNNDFFINFR